MKKIIIFSFLALSILTFQAKAQQWVESTVLKNVDWNYSFSGGTGTVTSSGTGIEKVSTPSVQDFLPKPSSGEVKIVTTAETGIGKVSFALRGACLTSSLKMVHTSGNGVQPAPAKFIVKDFESQSKVMSTHFNLTLDNTDENYQAIWYIAVGQSGNGSVTGNGAPAISGYLNIDSGVYSLLRLRKTTVGGNYSLQVRYNDGSQPNSATYWGWQSITNANLVSGTDAKIDMFFNNTDVEQSYTFKGEIKTLAAATYHIYINDVQKGTNVTEAARMTRNLSKQNQSVKYTGDLSGFGIMSREAAHSNQYEADGTTRIYDNSAWLTISNFTVKHLGALPSTAQWVESGNLKSINWDYNFSGGSGTVTSSGTGIVKVSTPLVKDFLPKPSSGEVKIVTIAEAGTGKASFTLNNSNDVTSGLTMVHTSGNGVQAAPAKFIAKDFESQSKVMSTHFNVRLDNTAQNYQAIWYVAVGQSGNGGVTGTSSPAISGYINADSTMYTLLRFRKLAVGGNYALQARYNDGTQANSATYWGWQAISGVSLASGTDAKIDLFFNNTDVEQSYVFNGQTKTLAAAAYHIYVNNVKRGTSTTESARMIRNIGIVNNQDLKYTGDLSGFSIMSREGAHSNQYEPDGTTRIYDNSASLTISNFTIKHLGSLPSTAQWVESGNLKSVNWKYSFSGGTGTVTSSGTGIEKVSTPSVKDFLPKPVSGEVKIVTTTETGTGKASFSLSNSNDVTSGLTMVHSSGNGIYPASAKFVAKDFESQSKVMSAHFNVTLDNTAQNYQAIWYVTVGQSGNVGITGDGSPAISGYSSADGGIYTLLRFRKLAVGGNYILQTRYNDGTQSNSATHWGWQAISGVSLPSGTNAKIDLFFNNTDAVQSYTFNGQTKTLAAAAYHIYINDIQRGTSTTESARLTRNLAQQNQSIKYSGDLNGFSIMSREGAHSNQYAPDGTTRIYDNSASLTVSNFEIKHLAEQLIPLGNQANVPFLENEKINLDKAVVPFENTSSQDVFSVYKLTNNNIKIILTSTKAEASEIIVTDISGKIIYKAVKVLAEGINELELPASNLKQAVYIIRVQTGSLFKSAKIIL